MRLSTQHLVLACSLLLALPPGWCCYFPGGRTYSENACAGTVNVRSCCKNQAHPAPSNQEPEPKQPFNCPCDERLSTPLEHSQACALDIALPTLVAPVAAIPALLGNRCVGFVGATSSRAGEPPLHLLNCLWLC
jgi:hypothetical protein